MFFSEYYGIDSTILEEYGAVDISFVCDIPLFIDPMLIFNSQKVEYQMLHEEIIRYFHFLYQKANSGLNEKELKAWFEFNEVPNNWLGYSLDGNKGAGLLVCGSCGRRVALNGSGKGYRCAQASVTGLEGCQCAKRNRYIIEEEILSTARDKAIEDLELLRKNKPKWHHAAREWKGTEALQNKADKLSEKKIRLYDHYKDGKLTKEEYLEQVKAVTDKLEAIRGQLAEIHTKASEAEYNLSASVELEERLKKVKNLEEYDTRVLKLILDEVIIKTDGTQEYHWTTNTSWRS